MTSYLVDCGDPTPLNGAADFSDTILGHTANISCDKGYDLIGDSSTTCTENGWHNPPTCEIQGEHVQ